MLFHPIAGRWGPACLRAATASVETVSPPLETLFYHAAHLAACRASRDIGKEAKAGHKYLKKSQKKRRMAESHAPLLLMNQLFVYLRDHLLLDRVVDNTSIL